MNRRRALIVLPAAALASCGKTELPEFHTPGKLIVGMDLSYPPFETTDKDGNPDGVGVRLSEALAKDLGRELQVWPSQFYGLLPALKSGKIDLIISSMTANDERRKSIDFSDPYAFTAIAMLVHRDSPVQSPADLKRIKNLRFTGKIGTTGDDYVRDQHPDNPLSSLDDESACVMEVVQGRADVFIYDQLSIYLYHKNNESSTRVIRQPIREEAWAVGIRKGNDPLREKVNAFLKKFRAEGGMGKLGDQYLSEAKKLLESMGIPFILR